LLPPFKYRSLLRFIILMEEPRTVENAIDSDQLENLKQRIGDAQDGLKEGREIFMGRVPHKTYSDFMDLSELKFCEDYGMTLAYLIEYYKLNEDHKQRYKALEDRIQSLEQRLAQTQSSSEDEKDENSKVNALNE